MRRARIKAEGEGYYHCVSKIIEQRMILNNPEKDRMLSLMYKLAAFGGLQILSYVFMTNHFHILLHVPARREISDQELLERLGHLYTIEEVKLIGRQIADYRAHAQDHAAEQLKARYSYRMYDLSEFFKAFKQRFSQYYNTREVRCGPLWTQRFKSILVESSQDALLTVAAYIELNPVRAGMFSDPKDYRYSSYGAAVAGEKQAREGLRLLLQSACDCGRLSWGRTQRLYRMRLYVQGEQKKLGPDGRPLRAGFTREEVEKVIAQGGRLPMPVVLRCRIRQFSDGLALGSRDFVERLFERYRGQFGAKRKSGACQLRSDEARSMSLADWPEGLCTLRKLRTAAFSTA